MSRTAKSIHPRIIFGFTLVAVGFLLLLDKFLPYQFQFADFWPLLLVIWGVARFSSHGSRGWGFSAALVIFGVIFLLQDYRPFSYIFDWDNLWPLALIALGGYLIARNLNRQNTGGLGGVSAVSDELRATTLVSNRKLAITSANFCGGNVTVALGGLEIDMREAKLSTQSPEVVIDVTTVMGGMELHVPEDWSVVLRASVILGEIEDKRPRSTVTQSPPTPAQSTTLVIDGVVLLGVVEILSNPK